MFATSHNTQVTQAEESMIIIVDVCNVVLVYSVWLLVISLLLFISSCSFSCSNNKSSEEVWGVESFWRKTDWKRFLWWCSEHQTICISCTYSSHTTKLNWTQFTKVGMDLCYVGLGDIVLLVIFLDAYVQVYLFRVRKNRIVFFQTCAVKAHSHFG